MTAPSVKASLEPVDPNERGFIDEIKEFAGDALDLFTGVNQADVAAGRVDLDKLPRSDRIALLIDGETSSIVGLSPWSIGLTLNASVSSQIHADKGGTLAFAIEAGLLDAAQAAVLNMRYALVWDDSIIAETGSVEVSVTGKSFLVIGLQDEPRGRSLTLWLTDNGVRVALVKQGTLAEVEKIRKEIIGDVGAAANKDPNPVVQAFNDVLGVITTSQIGGVVVLLGLAVALVMIVRSQAGKDIARTAAKVVS